MPPYPISTDRGDVGLRILIVTSRFPYPSWRGNQVRTSEWLAALKDHQRVVVCPNPDGIDDARRLRDEGIEAVVYANSNAGRVAGIAGAIAGGNPLQEGLYATSAAKRAVARAVAEARPEVAVIQMVRCGWAVDVIQRAAGSVPIVFDAIDAMGLHFDRAAAFVSPAVRTFYRSEAVRCRRRELALARIATITTAVSSRDLIALQPTDGRVIPVAGREVEAGGADNGAPSVLLSGNLGYRPTVQGALWFAREVWPAVRARVPDARWILAGARPVAAVRRLERLPGVEVHADVPDLAAFLGRATVSIAPMMEGSGVPMKVLEAWAAGVPVVGQPWAADGLEAGARGAMVIAEEAGQWQEALCSLLNDPEAARRRAELGRASWRDWYHPNRVAQLVRDVVDQAAEGPER